MSKMKSYSTLKKYNKDVGLLPETISPVTDYIREDIALK